MTIISQWRSFQGSRTDDNRDYVVAASLKARSLFMIADGASSKKQSGLMAKQLCNQVIEAFKSQQVVSMEDLQAALPLWHSESKQKYRNASVSYLLAWVTDDREIQTLHAGDCRLGFISLTSPVGITWKTNIHSLANAITPLAEEDLKNHPARHTLTRSFNSKRYINPEHQVYRWPENKALILATDGFWADLNNEQQVTLTTNYSAMHKEPEDDTSFILMTDFQSYLNQRK